MKHDTGDRTINNIKVLVNNTPLNPQASVAQHRDPGLERSYVGNEPQQLALAVRAEHLHPDSECAKPPATAFMIAVIAKLDNIGQLSSANIAPAPTTPEH